jgi:hypothetical protein
MFSKERTRVQRPIAIESDSLTSTATGKLLVQSDFAEMSMGAGKFARIDLREFDGGPVYRVTAGYGITIQATYLTLDRALDMAALFADVEWDITVATSWRDSDLIITDP